jgi:hypothetical protein
MKGFTLKVRTPSGWKEPAAVAKSELSEHEAHMLAAEIYGEEYWAHLMGGEEKVRVVPRAT